MSMNPRETTDRIRSDYQEYLSSILTVKDPTITALANGEIKKNEFVKGPYLESTLPFEDGATLKTLAEQEHLISDEFSKMGKNVHYEDWHLRIHQEQALRKIITENRNMVVSTGTGSGKTECYLYPIFNAIMREKEAGTLDNGVRALLLFPMNALANDQQKKLRKLLKNYPDITFGRYTGETPYKEKNETVQQAEARLHKEYDRTHGNADEEDLRKALPNEFMCRDKMIECPPHILLTNYAMLEYLLLRPDTAPFFDDVSAQNWRFIVIDEAHTYKGATGTEIAFLLRRLKERIRRVRKEPFTCIATSATLGSEEGKADLAAFAQNLFGEPFSAEDVITTKRRNRVVPDNARPFSPEEYKLLKAKTADKPEFERGAILTDALVEDSRLYVIYDALQSRPKKIDDVADKVFYDLPQRANRLNALVDLIELAAAAKKSEFEAALLPARYHLFIKSLEGLFVQFLPEKKVFVDRRERTVEDGRVFSVFELANCQRCGQEYLIGKTDTVGNETYLRQTSSAEKPEYFFITDKDSEALASFDEDDDVEETSNMGGLNKYHLCLACGRITPFAEVHPQNCCEEEDSSKIVTVYNLKYSGKSNESNCCPCCGATRKGLIKRFLTANQPATFAIAKSLYDAIPPRPFKKTESREKSALVSSDNPFDDLFDDLFENDEIDTDNSISDESGRKLLIFSDNRQEAAFFAGFFEKKYQLIMWRKAILHCLDETVDGSLQIDDLITRLTQYADKCKLYSFDIENDHDLTDIQKSQIAARYVMQEFLNPDTATGLEGLGLIRIEPSFVRTGLEGNERENILRLMLDTLRQKGAVSYPEDIHATDDFFAPRNHYGYFREKGSTVENGKYVYGFIPNENTVNKRSSFLKKLALQEGLDDEAAQKKAESDLAIIYQKGIIGRLLEKRFIKETHEGKAGTVYYLNYAKWSFSRVHAGDVVYRCKKCGKVFSYSVRDLCPSLKCNGMLERISSAEIQNVPYFGKLYADTKLIPMEAREHTAQLSAETASDYQKNFEEGKINVLSCSTTFEMGVDVGELEATFQRNVPPETANYIQRAGRAGRRTSSAAFSVTFSRRSSHDMTFFQDPAKIIAGKISAPILEVTNEKIARRHLHSVVVSWFFKQRPEFFKENTKRIVAQEQEDMAQALRTLLEAHPQDLMKSIRGIFSPELCREMDVDRWDFIEELTGKEGSLTKAIAERKGDLEGLRALIESTPNDYKNLRKAISAEKLINTLEKDPSLSFLSSKGVLPKYGFPIDTVSLDIISGEREESKKIDLSRDLKMAINEFAPPAQIVANGRVWSSYAINTIPNKSWPTYVYYECPSCRRISPPEDSIKDVTFNLQDAPKKACENCGTLMNAKKFIIPLFGFSTNINEKPKPVGDNKPGLYYSTQTQFWGVDDLTQRQKAEAKEETTDLYGKQIHKIYSPGGKLFVLNQGTAGRGFLVCPNCGYTIDPLKRKTAKGHRNKFDRQCSCSLANASLGHVFSTDILKLEIPSHAVKLPDGGEKGRDLHLSILFALIEGACSALDISREDISGCVDASGNLVLFDDTPGGSGFVKEIYESFEKVLREARNKVSGRCGCAEETSCYGCLRTYSNQYYHDVLSRGLAKEYLDWLLDKNTVVEVCLPKDSESHEVEAIGTRKLSYVAPKTDELPDSLSEIEDLLHTIDDPSEMEALKRLRVAAQAANYEHPCKDMSLPAETDIWPELFWPKSRVALFAEGDNVQIETLKQYNWYCYTLNDSLNPDLVFSHVLKKEEL